MSSARDAASSADVARPSPGTGMPYASATRLASGALRASRPSARTSPSTPRTVAWSRPVAWACVVVEAINLPLLDFSVSQDRGRAPSDGARFAELLDLVGLVVQELLQDLGVVLAEQRRPLDLHGGVRQRERAAHGREPAPLGMVDVDDHALGPQA